MAFQIYNPNMARTIVVMGVSGSGKSSVGKALAAALGWEFQDGDDYMPAANVRKMASGTPLTDEDRLPWLDILGDLIANKLADGVPLVLACSALKESYRQRLQQGDPQLIFVHLAGDFDLIQSRLEERPGHFMKAGMLQSQFDTLEAPNDAIVVDVAEPIEKIVGQVVKEIRASSPS
jgi:gluconokinase